MPNAEAQKPLNPADLRGIFGENLRALSAAEPSVSELCRRIGINRTQFSRYLTGETFPRPDVLYKICNYFNVDANILIRRLSVGSNADVLRTTLMRLADFMPPDHYDVRSEHLPDGYYQHFRRSMAYPDHVIVTLSRIWREDGVTLWKSYEPSTGNMMMLDSEVTPPLRRAVPRVPVLLHRGTVMRLNSVLCVLGGPINTRVIRVFTIDAGLGGNPDLYTGYVAILRNKVEGVLNVTPVVTQRLDVGPRTLMRMGRQEFFRQADSIPSRLRRYLFQTQI